MPDYITKEDLNNKTASDTGLNQPIKALDQLNVLAEKFTTIINTFTALKKQVKPDQEQRGAFQRTESLTDKAVANVQQKEVIKEVIKEKKITPLTAEAVKEIKASLKNLNQDKKIKECLTDIKALEDNEAFIPVIEQFLIKYTKLEDVHN